MGKRKNLKRRDTEVEGDGSGSDVTLSVVENERDSGEESDLVLREGANTRRETVNFEPPMMQRENDFRQNGDPEVDLRHEGIDIDQDEQAEGDAARPRVRENNDVTTAMKEMTQALVKTIRESNRAISQNLTHVLEEVQRRPRAAQVNPAQYRAGRTEQARRPGPNMRQSLYSRSEFSDTEDDDGMYQGNRYLQNVDSVQQRETTKLPIFTGKEQWNVWFNRFTEVADRRGWSNEDRLDEILPRLQGTAGEFVFGQLRREVRSNYSQLVSELNSRFRVVVTKKTYGAQFSHRDQKVSETVEEYAAELKRLYDKAHANRDEETRKEDLVRRFLDGLHDEKARFQVEYVKEPKDIDEAVYQVVDFQETRRRPLMGEYNSEKKSKRHARSVSFAPTEDEDSDDESEETEDRTRRVKRKRHSRVRRTGNSQSSASGKPASGNLSEKPIQEQKPAGDGHLEKTLKALQDKIVSLEKQLQQRGNSARSPSNPNVVCFTCSEVGHYSRNCPQKGLGRRNSPYYGHHGNGIQGGNQRRGSSYYQNDGYQGAFQGVGQSSSQALN